MATEASASKKAKELSKAQIEQLQGVFSGALNGAVAECGVESLPALLRYMAKQMEHEASTLDGDRPPLSDEEVKASHTQLMISLGKKEENVMDAFDSANGEGVPEVEFTPTFFGDAAKAVRFKNGEGEFVSWGFTTDFAPFEQFLWPLFKELVEGTMAVETHSGPKYDPTRVTQTPEVLLLQPPS